jgi:2-phosphosulfolactate phosphatase
MKTFVHGYAFPEYDGRRELAGGVAVVVDVLRASTTIVHALDAGAQEIIPCLEIEEARALAAGLPRDQCVLGGERGALPIEGFDLGNSPAEYHPGAVGGKTIVFTTSNGTRALLRAREARRVLVGAFVNASAVLRLLAGEEQIHLMCAGSNGQVTRDDVLLAGMFVARLQQSRGAALRMNAQAVTARENWISSFAVPYVSGAERLPAALLAAEFRKSLAGQRMVSLGLEDDLLTAAQIDQFDAVPELDLRTLRIHLARDGQTT